MYLPSDRKIYCIVKPLADGANREWTLFDICTDPTIIVRELLLALFEAFIQLDNVGVLQSSGELRYI